MSKSKQTFVVVGLLSIALSTACRREGKGSNREVIGFDGNCMCGGIRSLLLATRPVSTENLLDVVAVVGVHFRFGQAAVPVRFVRLEVFNVGKAVVQLRVVVIGFVVLFLVAVLTVIGTFIISVVMVLVEFVLGHGLDGGWF